MRRIVVLFLLSLLATACDDYRGPRLAITTSAAGTEAGGRPVGGAPVAAKGPATYGGKTAEQWGKLLQGTDREEVAEACRALTVMHREGRDYLFQGLDSTNPETRRLCLRTLTIADFKRLGDMGRQKLVKLGGDRDDVRIRERATFLLTEWQQSIPAP